MPLFSTIDIEQGHYFYRLERSFIMTGKYNRKKGRRNIHRGRRRRRIEMIQTAGVVTVVLFSFMIIIGFARKSSAEQGGDTPWNLILVNNKNHIPKDYKPKLTEVQGGEYVDERIYAPLMEMLEAAREGNGGKLPLVVSGYRTPEKQQELYDEKIIFVTDHQDARIDIQKKLLHIGKRENNYYIPSFLNGLDNFKLSRIWIYYLLQLLLFLAIVMSIFLRHTYAYAFMGIIFLVNINIYALMSREMR